MHEHIWRYVFPDAEVRWSRKRRWRWPQSICPPSMDMLGGRPSTFPTLKSCDPKSLSLEVLWSEITFSEVDGGRGSSEGQAGGGEVQIAAIGGGGELRWEKSTVTRGEENPFFSSHLQHVYLLLPALRFSLSNILWTLKSQERRDKVEEFLVGRYVKENYVHAQNVKL